jgi:hypothetical protein
MAAKGKKLTEDEIGQLANAEINSAITYDGTDYQTRRTRAMEYYRGEMKDVDNEDGLSTAVSRDVKDVIGWMLPGLMRVFFSSDDLGQYSPEDEDDEVAAEQATNYVNYVVMKECRGYQVFWDVFHDALLFANGIVKHWWEEKEKTTVHFASGLDDDQFASLVNDSSIRIIAHRVDHIELPPPDPDDIDDNGPIQLPPQVMAAAGPPQPPGGTGPPPPPPPGGAGSPPPGGLPPNGAAPPPPSGGPPQPPNGGAPPPGGQPPGGGLPPGLMQMLAGQAGATGPPGLPMMPPPPPQPVLLAVHTLKFKRTVKVGCLKLAAVPPEEFLINIQARTIEDARFVGHRMLKTRSELVEEGYDPEKIADLPTEGGLLGDFGNLPQTRLDASVYYPSYPGMDPSMEQVEIVEVYMPMDADGDGVAEMMKIVMAGPNTNVVLDSELWEDEVPFTDFVANRLPHRWQGESVFEDTEDIQRIKSTLLRQFLDNLYHSNIPDRAVAIDQITNPDALLDRKIGNIIHVEGNPQSVIADLQVPFVAKEALTGLEYMDQIVERRTGVSQSTMALDLEALQNQSATAVNAAQSASYSKIELIARNFKELGFKRFFECCLKLLVAHQDGPRRVKIKKQWVDMDPASWNANMKYSIDTGLGSGSRDRDSQILTQIASKQEQINLQLGPGNPVCTLEQYANTLRTLVTSALPGAEPDRYFSKVDMNSPKVQSWMQQMSQPKPDPKAEAAQMQAQTQMQKAQADIQIKQQRMQADTVNAQNKMQGELQGQAAQAQASLQVDAQKNAMHAQTQAQGVAADAQVKNQQSLMDAQHKHNAMLLDAQLKQHELEMEAALTQEANRMKAVNEHHKVRAMANIQQQKVSQKGT